MGELVPFKNKKYESITLADWVSSHPSEEDLRTVFLNMDRALKYIHDHGYCIEVFYPTEIEILENEKDHIQFKRLLELSKDPAKKREMVKEDIFNSSLIQIGIYSNSLKYLNPDFVKENFDEFAQFIPSGDVPYYRGVIQRGASVYFCEFALEKRNRDLADLEKQLGEGDGKGKQLMKQNGQNVGVGSITNDKVNDTIYSQINGLRDAAFINFLILPTLILGILVILGAVAWVISLI
ncbi:MAG: hypothetical protein HFE81_07140 [Bacilli bacterium]|nr:hypothetical protein [Bacilli bacterium]